MNKWNKFYAALGSCLALLLVTKLVPKQTVVIGPENTVPHVKSSKPVYAPAEQRIRAVAKTAAPATIRVAGSETQRVVATGKTVAAGPNAAVVVPQPSIGPVVEPDAPLAATSIDFGGSGLLKSIPESLPLTPESLRIEPWAPVVTRSDNPTPSIAIPASSQAADRARPVTVLGDAGLPNTHASVAPVLAAHPDRDLVLCLAGCGGGTSIVEIRRRTHLVAAVTSEMVPTAGGVTRPETGDVVCVAGCAGTPGQVVFRNVRLSWIGDEGRTAVKAALRAIADRVIANQGLDIESFPRTWVSAAACRHLTGERGEGDPPAFAGPLVAGWKTRVPVASIED